LLSTTIRGLRITGGEAASESAHRPPKSPRCVDRAFRR
jgi:hypothetical protein